MTLRMITQRHTTSPINDNTNITSTVTAAATATVTPITTPAASTESLRLSDLSTMTAERVYAATHSSSNGLTAEAVAQSAERHGSNIIERRRTTSWPTRLRQAFINPFTLILLTLAAITCYTDVIAQLDARPDPTTMIIILTMVAISGTLRIVQETKSGNAAERLHAMISTTCQVRRDGRDMDVAFDDVVVGDVVQLAAGDMVPADLRIVEANDLFINQATLTGESEPSEKTAAPLTNPADCGPSDYTNMAFMGTNVVSGSAIGIVIAVGSNAMFGDIAATVQSARATRTSFDKGVGAASMTLVRFMLVMAPIILLINGLTKGNWFDALMFAISVAVGLTPEMLPMIVTTCLAKGAVSMSRKQVIVKNLNAMQDLGSIDILCTDKTGTLTEDHVVLERHLDVTGREDTRVLRHAFLNSYHQTGLRNLIDAAIIERTRTLQHSTNDPQLRDIDTRYHKIDEIPFDFTRRRMSVVVQDNAGKRQLITKGAVEEMLTACSHVQIGDAVLAINDALAEQVRERVTQLNTHGLRVIGVAHKRLEHTSNDTMSYSCVDESNMVLIGYLAFLDPPKASAPQAISALRDDGVDVKVLTGDNEAVARAVCREVGLGDDGVLLGADIDHMDDEQLTQAARNASIFAKLSPAHKARVVRALRDGGHTVGFMGDGINDAPAMHASDVGISVDTAVDIAKETADIILLHKDLMVLEHGIIEGRRIYANMMKYIKVTASSNFGNMLSVVVASIALPFLPMSAVQLLTLNLAYDITCTSLPWDNVDSDYLRKPRPWTAASLPRFMTWFGPVSSLFDLTTYALMFFVICPMATGGLGWDQLHAPAQRAVFIATFQAGWFIESMWTQTLVIHMLRSQRLPFIGSRASLPTSLVGLLGIIALTALPFTPLGAGLDLAAVPLPFFGALALTVIAYLTLSTIAKALYVRRYGELL